MSIRSKLMPSNWLEMPSEHMSTTSFSNPMASANCAPLQLRDAEMPMLAMMYEGSAPDIDGHHLELFTTNLARRRTCFSASDWHVLQYSFEPENSLVGESRSERQRPWTMVHTSKTQPPPENCRETRDDMRDTHHRNTTDTT